MTKPAKAGFVRCGRLVLHASCSNILTPSQPPPKLGGGAPSPSLGEGGGEVGLL